MTLSEEQNVPIHHPKPVSIVAIGAGNRMRTYMHYAELNPDKVQLVAVIEKSALRRDNMGDKFSVPASHRFEDYDSFFNSGIKADAVVICTPDDEHYRPCMMAIQHGMHVMLEKPIAQTQQQCIDIQQAAHKAGVIVCICHVMRYHPCFIQIKKIIASGELGKVISINHIEGVGLDRATHAYVRGIWNRSETSNPMILAKCCHDVDFLLWITGRHCSKVSSFGSLRWFRKENAPEGSAPRCLDCKVESSCPYSAVELYLRRHEWIRNFDLPENCGNPDSLIEKRLREGNEGRCVFHCDNDVVDHQTMMMELDDETTISLSMDIFTQNDVRKIEIKMTGGEIVCDEKHLLVTHFRNRQTESFDFTNDIQNPYHGGADLKIIEDFVQMLQGERKKLPSLVDDSIESHIVCFEAERSRLTNRTVLLEPHK